MGNESDNSPALTPFAWGKILFLAVLLLFTVAGCAAAPIEPGIDTRRDSLLIQPQALQAPFMTVEPLPGAATRLDDTRVLYDVQHRNLSILNHQVWERTRYNYRYGALCVSVDMTILLVAGNPAPTPEQFELWLNGRLIKDAPEPVGNMGSGFREGQIERLIVGTPQTTRLCWFEVLSLGQHLAEVRIPSHSNPYLYSWAFEVTD
jgi:hypothetical protein